MKVNKSTLVGVVCAVCCAACVALYLAHVNQQAESERAEALARYGGEQIEVLVATRNIAAGETVTEGSVDVQLWLADLLPEGAVTSADEVVGKQLGSSILKGEVVSTQRLSKTSSDFEVPEGMAAVSVPTRDVQALGGALQPGMSVQVYATGASSTSLLIKDALVLETSLADSGSLTSSSSAWVTLAVPAESVQELVAAAQNLELYFVLLGKSDDSVGKGESADAGDEADSSGVAGSTSAAGAGDAAELSGAAGSQSASEPEGTAAAGTDARSEGAS